MSSLLLGAAWLMVVMTCFASMTPVDWRRLRIKTASTKTASFKPASIKPVRIKTASIKPTRTGGSNETT